MSEKKQRSLPWIVAGLSLVGLILTIVGSLSTLQARLQAATEIPTIKAEISALQADRARIEECVANITRSLDRVEKRQERIDEKIDPSWKGDNVMKKKWSSRTFWASTALLLFAQVLRWFDKVSEAAWIIVSIFAVCGYLVANSVKRIKAPGFEYEAETNDEKN